MRQFLLVMMLAITFLGVTSIAAAQQDEEGSSDHPLLTRYPGFYINEYSTFEFDRAEIITGLPYEDDEGDEQLTVQRIEGAVTNIQYRAGETDASTFAILSNYMRALEKLDADILYSCEGRDECGFAGFRYADMVNNKPNIFKGLRTRIRNDYAILSAQLSHEDQSVHILLIISVNPKNGNAYVNQSIISSAELDVDKVGIGSLEDIVGSLDDSGSVILEGVQFDFDTADLKPESGAVLDILQTYLERAPDVSVFIVGHSDNTGAYDYNLNLSEKRAEAVVANLTSRGIQASRLTAIGVGPVSPVASNEDETGQALNRRVEMVIK